MLQLYHFLREKSIVLLLMVALFVPNFVFAQTPNDELYYQQKDFWNVVNLEQAWDFATGSPQVVVAVIDTGADIWHDDLKDNIWHNPYEIADNKIDDDDNGFVDDVNGWNFIENNNNVRPSVLDTSDDPEAIRHGTIIAGLIGEKGNNGKDGVGVNWQVKIMPIRAIDSNGSGDLEVVAKAVDYAVNNGAMVISMSMVSAENDDVLRASLIAAYEKGVVIVAAAGNSSTEITGDGNSVYPVCFDSKDKKNWIIGVGSVNTSSKFSWFSNYGDSVDLYAPGDSIYGAERYAPVFGYNEEFGGPWKGTSFATPIVAGAAALLKSVHPDWKADKIIETLLDTATDFYLDRDQKWPAKIVNIGAAVKVAIDDDVIAAEENYYTYYFTKNEIRRRDQMSRERGVVAHLAGIKIVDLAVKTNQFGKTDLAVLFQRGKYFYVRLYKDNGVWWQEFAVKSEKYGKEIKTPQKIVWNNDEIGLSYKFSKKTRLAYYDRLGGWLRIKDKNIPILAQK